MFVFIAAASAAPLTVAISNATLTGDAVTIRPLDGVEMRTFGAIQLEGNSGEEIMIGDVSLETQGGVTVVANGLAAAPIDAASFTTTETGCTVDAPAVIVGVDGGGIIKGDVHEGAERDGGGIVKGTLNEGAERTDGGIVTGTIVEGSERVGGGVINGTILDGSERVGGGVVLGNILEGSERIGGGVVLGNILEGSERIGGGVVKGSLEEGTERASEPGRYCSDTGPDCFAVALIDGPEDFAPAVVVEDAMLSAWFEGAESCAVEVWSSGRLVGRAEGGCEGIAALTAATAPWEVFASTVGGVPQVTLGWTGTSDDPAEAAR